MRTTAESTRGGGSKAVGRHVEQRLDAVAPLQHHAQAAVVLAARRGGHAVDDLLLQHEVLVHHLRRAAEQVKQDRRRDVVRQVADHAQLLRRRGRPGRRSPPSARRPRSPSSRGLAAQPRGQVAVEFDHRQRAAALEQRAGQRAQARADLDQRLAGLRRDRARRSRSITPSSARKCWPKRLRAWWPEAELPAWRSRRPAGRLVTAAARASRRRRARAAPWPTRDRPARTSARAARCAPARAAGLASSATSRRSSTWIRCTPKRDTTGGESHRPAAGSSPPRTRARICPGDDPAQVAARGGRAVFAVLARHVLEAALAALDLRLRYSASRRAATSALSSRRRAQQDVARPRLRDTAEPAPPGARSA